MITLANALLKIESEVCRAKAKHPGDFHNFHEAYAVILEEMDELKLEVWKGGSVPRDAKALETELIQTAAMCVRALTELL